MQEEPESHLCLVAHSHGGNVVLDAAHVGKAQVDEFDLVGLDEGFYVVDGHAGHLVWREKTELIVRHDAADVLANAGIVPTTGML